MSYLLPFISPILRQICMIGKLQCEKNQNSVSAPPSNPQAVLGSKARVSSRASFSSVEASGRQTPGPVDTSGRLSNSSKSSSSPSSVTQQCQSKCQGRVYKRGKHMSFFLLPSHSWLSNSEFKLVFTYIMICNSFLCHITV